MAIVKLNIVCTYKNCLDVATALKYLYFSMNFQLLTSAHWILTTVMIMPHARTLSVALHVPVILGSLEMESLACHWVSGCILLLHGYKWQ